MKLSIDETEARCRIAAIHEAGHIVAAATLGMRIHAGWVSDDGDYGGAAASGGSIEDEAVFIMAGHAAEALFLSDELKQERRKYGSDAGDEDTPRWFKGTDDELMLAIAAEAKDFCIDTGLTYLKARALLETNAAAVMDVAAKLLDPGARRRGGNLLERVTGNKWYLLGPGEVLGLVLSKTIKRGSVAPGADVPNQSSPELRRAAMFNFLSRRRQRLEQESQSKFDQYRALVQRAAQDGDLKPADADKLEKLAAELGIPIEAAEAGMPSVTTDCALAREHHQLGPDVAAEKERAAAVEASGRASAKYQAETDRIIEERRRGGWELDQLMTKAEVALGRTHDAVQRVAAIESLRPEIFGKPSPEIQARQRHLIHRLTQYVDGQRTCFPEPKLPLPHYLNFAHLMKDARLNLGGLDFFRVEWIAAPGQTQKELDELVALARLVLLGSVPELAYLVTAADHEGKGSFPIAEGNSFVLEYVAEDAEKGVYEIEGDVLLETQRDDASVPRAKLIQHPGQPASQFRKNLRKLEHCCLKGKAWQTDGKFKAPDEAEFMRVVDRVEYEHRPGATVTAAG